MEEAPLSQTARAQITKLLVMLDNEETPFPQNPFLFPYQKLCVDNYPLAGARIERLSFASPLSIQSLLIARFEALVHYARQPSMAKHGIPVRRRQEVFPKLQESKARHSAVRVASWTCQMNCLLLVVEA
jgi:hypothetical protein